MGLANELIMAATIEMVVIINYTTVAERDGDGVGDGDGGWRW